MLLNDKSGIACDLCGLAYQQDFTYYSFDFRLVETPQPISEILLYQPVHSLDVCPACYLPITVIVKNNYKAMKSGICCDLSSVFISGIYYYCVVSKIVVNVSNQQVDDRYLDIVCCEEEYKSLVNRSITVKSAAGKWTTSS